MGGQSSSSFVPIVIKTNIPLMILRKNIFCKDMENELKSFHNKTDWANFVLVQDSWQQLKWQRTLKNSHNLQNQWHVVSTLCQEMKNHLTRKVGFEGTPKFHPCYKSQPPTCKGHVEWKLELNVWTKTILTRGSEFLMAWINWWRTWVTTKRTTTTSRKPLRCSSKKSRWKRMYLLLRADQRPKQNHEDLPLLAHLQELYLSVKDVGLILSQELDRISITQCQKDWLLFFVMVDYLGKKMVRLNSGD